MEDDLEPDSNNLYQILRNTNEPLWLECETHTVLSTMSELLNLKVQFNMMVNCYDRIVVIIKKILSKDEKLVGSFYTSKKMMKELGMRYENIDACHNDCMLFYKEDQLKSSCNICGKN